MCSLQYIIISATSSRVIISFVFGHKDTGRRGCRKYVVYRKLTFILGYTDESFGVYDKGACIILDDFTLDCKYVDFPFKVKSSAIKILTVKNGCSLRYVYEYLNYMNLETTEHKRHYISEIEPMIIAYPTDKKGIDDFNNIMSSFESKIEIENKYLQSLLTQKVYLLSNMFI